MVLATLYVYASRHDVSTSCEVADQSAYYRLIGAWLLDIEALNREQEDDFTEGELGEYVVRVDTRT